MDGADRSSQRPISADLGDEYGSLAQSAPASWGVRRSIRRSVASRITSTYAPLPSPHCGLRVRRQSLTAVVPVVVAALADH